MKNFKTVGDEIAAHINAPISRARELISLKGARFVLCGPSGCGKTRAIDHANQQLEDQQQIAECLDLVSNRDLLIICSIFNNEELEYPDAKNIAFSVLKKEMAETLEKQGVKVFWFGSQ